VNTYCKKYELVWGVLEGGLPRQNASIDGVTHELGYEAICTGYFILVNPNSEEAVSYLENPVREVARR